MFIKCLLAGSELEPEEVEILTAAPQSGLTAMTRSPS
jgi:hypothetical protein